MIAIKLLALASSVAVSGGLLIAQLNAPLQFQGQETIESENKIEQQGKLTPLQKWLFRLSVCESNGRADIKVLDTNNRFSHGALQFQWPTWAGYASKVFTEAEEQELWNLIYDKDAQMAVAEYMVKENYENWRHWKVCTKKVGLPPQ